MACRFTTLESALACLVSLLLYWGHQRFAAILQWRRNRRLELQQPLLQKEALDTQPAVSQERKTWKQLSVLAWPGALNMLSIIVQGMGLQYISASVSQMISGDALPRQTSRGSQQGLKHAQSICTRREMGPAALAWLQVPVADQAPNSALLKEAG